MSAHRASSAKTPIEDEIEALAQDCQTLAQRLAALTTGTVRAKGSTLSPFASAQIRRYLRARRMRERLLPAELFADPAWDMLLDLYASELEGHEVSITSACIASAVPATTALRWLGRIEELGLIERKDDQADSRRTFVRLTTTAKSGINRWLAQAPWLAGMEQENVGSFR